MYMKNIKKFLFGVVFCLLFLPSVSADTLNDLNMSVIKDSSIEGGQEKSFLYIQNINADTSYQVLYSADSNVPNEITDSSLFDSKTYLSSARDSSLSGLDSFGYTDYASMYGNVYVTLYVYNNLVYEKVSNPILVEKPANLDYGKRMEVSLYSLNNDVDILIHDIYNKASNINVKVGEITNKTLLENFASSKDYSEILSFAKNDENPVITFSGKTSNSSSLDGKYDSSNIVDGNYYYIYLSIDTENGKYYPLDEIVVSQAKNKNLSSNFDFDFTNAEQGNQRESHSIEAPTTIKDDKETSKTTDNPTTGIYGGSIVLVVSALVFYAVFRRKNKFNNI